MRSYVQMAMMGLMLTGVAACQQAARPAYSPKPEEMRQALLDLMDKRPDIAIPEFRLSLEHDQAVERDGIVYIGTWNCDPKLMTFDVLFSAPNITMYEVAGRFEKDNRGEWVAIPRRVQLTQKQDVGEIWRPYDVDPRR